MNPSTSLEPVRLKSFRSQTWEPAPWKTILTAVPSRPIFQARRSPTRSVGRAIFKVLAAVGVVLLLLALLLPAVRTVPEASRRNHCSNMLKQIALALQNYHDVYHGFPPAYTVDDSGRPLHSWRTLILPYIEERALYKTIDLSKPWDDPANAAACQLALDEYQCPSSPHEGNRTSYLAIVTPNSCLRPANPGRCAISRTGRQRR